MSSTLLESTRPAAGQCRAALPRHPVGCWGEMIERMPADEAVFLVDELSDASRLLMLADRVVVAAGASGEAAADELVSQLSRLGMPVQRANPSAEAPIEATDTVVVIAEGDDAPTAEGDLWAARPVDFVTRSSACPEALVRNIGARVLLSKAARSARRSPSPELLTAD